MNLLIKIFISVVSAYFLFFGIVGPAIYSKATQSIRNEAKRHLITVRELKKLELENYFTERVGDLSVLSKDPVIQESLPLFIESFNGKGFDDKKYVDAEKEYGTNLTYYVKTYGYEDLFLVDVEGNVVFTAVNDKYRGVNLLNMETIDPMIPDIFMRGRTEIAFSDYVWFELFNELTAFGAAPVKDRRGDVMGVLLFHLSFDQIEDIMKKRPGLGVTGETYIVGEDKLMRSNSRFASGTTAYELKVDTLAARAAMRGETGVNIIKDYRGKSVVSAYTPLEIEHFNWIMLAEMDVDEIFSSINKLRLLLYSTSALITVGVGIYGYVAYRKEMRLVEVVEETDVDYEEETDVDYEEEPEETD